MKTFNLTCVKYFQAYREHGTIKYPINGLQYSLHPTIAFLCQGRLSALLGLPGITVPKVGVH